MNMTQFLAGLDSQTWVYVILAFGWDDVIVAVVLMIISATITALTAKRPQQADPAQPSVITDFNFPQIDEGVAQTVVFGDVWLSGWQVMWYGNLRSEGIPAPSSGGGKK